MKTNTSAETLKEQLSKAYADSFMKPYVTKGWYREIENTHGETTIVPADVCDSGDAEDYADYIEGTPDELGERTEGYLYRLSAPGYMDCTEWSAAETLEEALHALLDMAE